MQNLRIFLPKKARVCTTHADLEAWKDAPFESLTYNFSAMQIEDMVDLLIDPKTKQSRPKGMSFDSFTNDFHKLN